MIRSLVKRFFRLLGKSDHRIIVVYAASASRYRDAVEYIRAEAPGFPVWLLAAAPIDPEVARMCQRVVEVAPGPRLPLRAASLLWPQWVVLNVLTCTREPGFGWMKAAPLFVFPWKVLVMNEQRDFFSALPVGLLLHLLRRLRDWIFTVAESAKDFLLGMFWKIVWTALDPLLALTTAPWLRPQQPVTLAEAPGSQAERFIRFTEDPPDGDPRLLEALFDRPDTFAAAFQPGRSGFQKDLLPRAAFRRLQPGEATSVLAPLGGTVLIDARKLAMLGGFPRARSRRCQWLLLYWKAARAGWTSYSVGSDERACPMIPDRAFPEAEFCWRLLGERPRPQPAAGSFDSRRGSICFPLRHRPKLSPDRPRILIVSPYLPFPLSHGGAVRIFNLARRLCERWDLLLLSFREQSDQVDYDRLSSCFARVIVIDHDERRAPDPSVPQAVSHFRSRAMMAAIRDAGERYRPHLLQVEYTQMAPYREALPGTPAVLVEHDVTFSLHRQLGSEFDLWYRFESEWLRRYEAVAVMSEEETAEVVAAGAPAERAWVVPNGVDTERFCPAPEAAPSPAELLYVGSFRHLPNLLGFEHLVREILPRVWRTHPGTRVRVVAGPDHERYWRRRSSSLQTDPRITVHGFVEDLLPCYARAAVVVVPLTVSAGTNIKVMEALACGKSVVSTPVGRQGLGLRDGEEILVAGAPDDFAAAIERLLREPDLRRRLQEQARRAAVERFSWESAALRAETMYRTLI